MYMDKEIIKEGLNCFVNNGTFQSSKFILMGKEQSLKTDLCQLALENSQFSPISYLQGKISIPMLVGETIKMNSNCFDQKAFGDELWKLYL